MEKKFDVSVEAQIQLENYFDGLNTLEQIEVLEGIPIPDGFFPASWYQYDEIYRIEEGGTQTPSDSFIPYPHRKFSPEEWVRKYQTAETVSA
jgi:hypothetical protein